MTAGFRVIAKQFLDCVLYRVNDALCFDRRAHPNHFYLVDKVALENTLRMFVFSDGMGISKELLRCGVHEDYSTLFLKNLLQPCMTCLDVGANIGYYALLEALLVGQSGQVYAIEPMPKNVALLKQNVALNKFENIKVYPCACGNYDGSLDLFLSKKTNLCGVIKHADSLDDTISCRAVTVDSFLREQGLCSGDIDLLRMDLEGYEFKALFGAKNLLKDSKRLILFVEFHPFLIKSQGWEIRDVMKLIFDCGFKPLSFYDESLLEQSVFRVFFLKGDLL
jgi:FkbM family methyltransferase